MRHKNAYGESSDYQDVKLKRALNVMCLLLMITHYTLSNSYNM